MTVSPKTWFITGASSGFGAALARHALAGGDTVVATARRPDTLEPIIASAPERALALRLDIDHPDQVEAAIGAALRRFGGIDVLVNNAGYGIVGALEETSDAQLRHLMETNFFGAVAVLRAALPSMRARRSGAIVNITSMGGQMSFAGVGAYSASKFALEGLSEALAQELAAFGIRVLIVEPGSFRTDFAGRDDFTLPAMADYRDVLDPVRAGMLAMHGAQPGDPAKAAAAIALALQADTAPLRLQLGADALAAIEGHARVLLRDLEQWRPIGLDTALDAVETSPGATA